ncbi:hypothetical protein GCM10028806_04040 [Spirosoma terrae]|uniref:Uncharacterized protein n=1 Tax=Spirosoma terrae TaxID=1968276 RepID=A0A6L9LCR3_9BACT|nr:hypothetical protein [Spirosoma terrae]NDU98355.1 hypothetical protein [Spirosoma terrae]
MYAKLIICEDESAISSDVINKTQSLLNLNSVDQLTSQVQWQMMASNLSAGKLIDLLLFIDELGFIDTNS